MPASPSSSCGAIRSPWRHYDSEGGQPSATDAGTLTTATDGTSEMGSVFHDPPTGADGHLQEDTISKMVSTSPAVHPSPCGQHTDSTMLPPLMPAPSLWESLKSTWIHESTWIRMNPHESAYKLYNVCTYCITNFLMNLTILLWNNTFLYESNKTKCFPICITNFQSPLYY